MRKTASRLPFPLPPRRGRSLATMCASSFALSPRESEVFALCAKGRDTAYICDELCVSNHTVRSHIYHIYGKMDIHSQQDLITIVENRVQEIKAGR